MKAILEFTLPEEQEEYETAANAHYYRAALQEIRQYLRNLVKHGDGTATIGEVYSEVTQILAGYEI